MTLKAFCEGHSFDMSISYVIVSLLFGTLFFLQPLLKSVFNLMSREE